MPFKREGKCVVNQDTGKSKGCSTSIGMAKKHLKALYANTKDIKKK